MGNICYYILIVGNPLKYNATVCENTGTQDFRGLLCSSSLYHRCPVIPKAITPSGAHGVSATDPFLPTWQTERYHVTNRTIWFPGCFWSPMLNKSRCAKSLLAFLQGHGRNRHWKNYLGEINSVSNPRQELPDGGLSSSTNPASPT